MRPQHLRSHVKNPTLIRPKTGLENLSADVAQLAYTKRNVRLGAINDPMELLAQITAANPRLLATIPVQMTFAPTVVKFTTGTLINPPQLMCPRNPLRHALILDVIGNAAGNNFWYMFGPPLKPINDTSGGVGVPTERYVGIPIVAGNFPGGGTAVNVRSPHLYVDEICPIDDIWLFTRGNITAPGAAFIAFEGTIPPDGNPL